MHNIIYMKTRAYCLLKPSFFYDTFVTTLIQNQMILADVLKIIDLLANKFQIIAEWLHCRGKNISNNINIFIMLEKIQKRLDILSAAKDANSAKILKELSKYRSNIVICIY
jgi:hypothetical protein